MKDMRASNVHIRKVRTGPSLPAGPQIDATQLAIREQVAARNAANAARRRRRKHTQIPIQRLARSCVCHNHTAGV